MANEKRRKATEATNSRSKKSKPDNSKESKKPSSSAKRSTLFTFKMINIKQLPEVDISKEDNLDNFKINGTNFVKTFVKLQRGTLKPSILRKIADEACVQRLKRLHIYSKVETRDLRVTCIQWHPSNPHLLVTGGKHGTLQLLKVSDDSNIHELTHMCGIGPGGTTDAIRFNTKRSGLEVCTASVDGTVSTYNFSTDNKQTLIDSDNPTKTWFTAVDIHQDGKSVYAGDNRGFLTIHHLDGKNSRYPMGCKRLHSTKIRHVEFNPRYPFLMVTASVDKSVKLWDIRKLSDNLECFYHNSGVSAAKFSLTDGCRLLTTDIQNELRVYQAPLWTLEHKIQHPHRNFQHLTSIKASWHPQADVFVIGCYPDSKMPDFDSTMRSVDVFLASSGKLCYELMESNKLLTSLSEFNSSGAVLATTSGRTVNFWK